MITVTKLKDAPDKHFGMISNSDGYHFAESVQEWIDMNRNMIYEQDSVIVDPADVPNIPAMLSQMTPDQMKQIAELLKPYITP